MSSCSGIAVDPDIAGAGVRTAFYIQSFSIVAASSIPGPDMKVSFWSLTATSLAVLLYTLIQAAMANLTLHNAILVSYFTVLNSIASLCVWLLVPAQYSGKMFTRGQKDKHMDIMDEPDVRPNVGLRFAMAVFHKPISFPLYLQWIAVYIYSFYVWGTVKTFGNYPDCNDATGFIFFGINSSATGMGRLVAIGALTALFCLVMIPTLMMIVTILAKMYELGRFWIWKRVEKASKDPRGTFGTHTLPIDVAFLYFWLYTVIIVEMTISRTATIHGPVKWTFRQIFPLVSVIVPVMGLYYALTVHLPQHLKRVKKAKEMNRLKETSSIHMPLLST